MNLLGKKVLVTGAAQGIGKAIALRLAKEGADVAAVDRHQGNLEQTTKEIASFGRQVQGYTLDLKKTAEIPALYERVVHDFGKLDIAVHAAGVISIQPFLETTEEDWDYVMDVNAKAMYFCVQQAARQMIATGGGRIINLSSITGKSSRPSYAVYAASKATILSITRSAAAAFAKHQIKVNAICPGYIPTAMWDKIDVYHEEGSQVRRQMLENIPLNRSGHVDEIAGLALYLSLPEADYITGQSINIDGGLIMD